jgi:hypothetical protein
MDDVPYEHLLSAVEAYESAEADCLELGRQLDAKRATLASAERTLCGLLNDGDVIHRDGKFWSVGPNGGLRRDEPRRFVQMGFRSDLAK